jgi:glycosyltransferase involved in cell wall biosynthesis
MSGKRDIRESSQSLNILFALNDMALGGSERYVLTLARQLKELGHNIYVASNGGSLTVELGKSGIAHYRSDFPIYRPATELPAGGGLGHLWSFVHCWLVKNPLRGMLSLFFLPSFLAHVKTREIDLVHCRHPGPTLFSYIAARRYGLPLVITVGGSRWGEFPPIFLNSVKKQITRVIAITPEVRDHLIDNYRLDPGRIEIIPGGVEPARVRGPASKAAKPAGADCVNILHFGGGAGVVTDRVVNAVPIITGRFPGIRLTIAAGNPDYRLIGRVNRSLGREVIRVVLPTQDTERLLEDANIVIAVGRSALEAMARGIPVVIAGRREGPRGGSFGGIPSPENITELKRYNFTGRNSPVRTTPERIAESVIELLAGNDYAQQVGDFCYRVIQSGYDIVKVARRVEELYRKALSG